MVDFHFILGFYDDEYVLHNLDLDYEQIVLYQGKRQISINLTENQFNEIKNLSILKDRLMK